MIIVCSLLYADHLLVSWMSWIDTHTTSSWIETNTILAASMVSHIISQLFFDSIKTSHPSAMEDTIMKWARHPLFSSGYMEEHKDPVYSFFHALFDHPEEGTRYFDALYKKNNFNRVRSVLKKNEYYMIILKEVFFATFWHLPEIYKAIRSEENVETLIKSNVKYVCQIVMAIHNYQKTQKLSQEEILHLVHERSSFLLQVAPLWYMESSIDKGTHHAFNLFKAAHLASEPTAEELEDIEVEESNPHPLASKQKIYEQDEVVHAIIKSLTLFFQGTMDVHQLSDLIQEKNTIAKQRADYFDQYSQLLRQVKDDSIRQHVIQMFSQVFIQSTEDKKKAKNHHSLNAKLHYQADIVGCSTLLANQLNHSIQLCLHGLIDDYLQPNHSLPYKMSILSALCLPFNEKDHEMLSNTNIVSALTHSWYVTPELINRNSEFVPTDECTILGCGQNSNNCLCFSDALSHSEWTCVDSIPFNVQTIVAGADLTYIISDEGKLYTIGSGVGNELNKNSTTNAMKEPIPVALETESKIVKVLTNPNAFHSFFITEKGEVFAMGSNTFNQCGLGVDVPTASTPQKVWDLMPKYSITDGTLSQTHSVLLTATHDVLVTGDNTYGQLGMNAVPTTHGFMVNPMFANKDICFVAAGSKHTLFANQHTLYSCGRNDYGQLGVNPQLLTHTATPMVVPLPPAIQKEGIKKV